MGNMMKRNKGTLQARPPSGAVYPHFQQQPFALQSSQQGPPAFQLQRRVLYTYGPPCQHGCIIPPNYGSPQSLLQFYQNRSIYDNDILLSKSTGWSIADIDRLRQEFLSHANAFGVIDRERFRQHFITALLNTTWEALERDAAVAFRSFDVNQTGSLDFNEFVIMCMRLTQEGYLPPMY